MSSSKNNNTDYEHNRGIVRERQNLDGGLVSPIDLSLEKTRVIMLQQLNWGNINDVPKKIKLTNTGDTALISGKWTNPRPYLSGGPLDCNYVFSQIHFHWGADEHEGSEHTSKGVCYPLELHVMFFKARYLTQEAALKHNDGIIIVVYFVKLSSVTTPGLKYIVSNLQHIREPHTSHRLDPLPFSSFLIPFSKDYLVYWGSLQTTRCSHTMMWLVCRAPLGITKEDLKEFRSLLNNKMEPMNKNFRIANDPQGRVVFHVNPSNEAKNLLLQERIDPPGKVMMVQYAEVPQLSPAQTFSKGDYADGDSVRSSCSDGSLKRSMSKQVLRTLTFSEIQTVDRSPSLEREKLSSPRMRNVKPEDGENNTNCLHRTLSPVVQSEDSSKAAAKTRPNCKSNLPVPKKNLKSSIAPYSLNTEIETNLRKPSRSTSPRQPTPFLQTTIPRPLGRNAGGLEFLGSRRPTSVPNKFINKTN